MKNNNEDSETSVFYFFMKNDSNIEKSCRLKIGGSIMMK